MSATPCDFKTCTTPAEHRVTYSKRDASRWKVYNVCDDHVAIVTRAAPYGVTVIEEPINPAPTENAVNTESEPSAAGKTCIMPGCDSHNHAHGFCSKHYSRCVRFKLPVKTDPNKAALMLVELQNSGKVVERRPRKKEDNDAITPPPPVSPVKFSGWAIAPTGAGGGGTTPSAASGAGTPIPKLTPIFVSGDEPATIPPAIDRAAACELFDGLAESIRDGKTRTALALLVALRREVGL